VLARLSHLDEARALRERSTAICDNLSPPKVVEIRARPTEV
jgi:hypothetical protein